jgi:hypothetical protein
MNSKQPMNEGSPRRMAFLPVTIDSVCLISLELGDRQTAAILASAPLFRHKVCMALPSKKDINALIRSLQACRDELYPPKSERWKHG